MASSPVAPERIARAKLAYSVRKVDLRQPLRMLSGPDLVPRHGDLVLAEVVSIGSHTKLELTTSRRAVLYPGDEIVVAYGARYAPDQFEAELPDDLDDCDLAAAGGCASRVRSRHSAVKDPTRIRPVGLLASRTGRLNVAAGALPPPPTPPGGGSVPTLLVAGTSMNAGKTTTVSSLTHGLSRAGWRVGAGKVTGTGAGGDRYCYVDAGAAEVLDFTDLGFVSTYRVPVPRLVRMAVDMHDHLVGRGVDVVVLEVADGMLHGETSGLVGHPAVRELVDGAVFAAADAAGALLGVARMHDCGQRVLAVSGLLTASPLATREAQSRLDVPVYGIHDLCDPALSTGLLHRIAPAHRDAAVVVTGP